MSEISASFPILFCALTIVAALLLRDPEFIIPCAVFGGNWRDT